MRIGAFAGGILGAVAAVITGSAALATVLAGGALGAVIGYAVEKRKTLGG